ncbi:MAG: hypothetical protein HDS95_07655 [Bacteroidales bacterium]|nr:hypothetical protein [Bacteroidales bacterium]MBD5287682.1 hypothetical protein [Bacteroides sp.]
MKTKLQKAIENKDKESARALVIELIEKHPDKRSTLDAVTMLVRNFPEVFDEDENDMRDIQRKDYSAAIKTRLTERLKENFSREKLSTFVDMSVSMARHPSDKTLPLDEDIVGELIADEFSVPMVGSPEGPENK